MRKARPPARLPLKAVTRAQPKRNKPCLLQIAIVRDQGKKKPDNYSKQRDSRVTEETNPPEEDKEERGELRCSCALVSRTVKLLDPCLCWD